MLKRTSTSCASILCFLYSLDVVQQCLFVVQGLTKEDAEAALRHCSGDGDAAMLHALNCLEEGGAAAHAQKLKGLATNVAHASPCCFAQAAAQQARQEADLQEAQQVLARLTANNSPIK